MLLTFRNLGLRLTKKNFIKNVRGLDFVMNIRLVQMTPAIQAAIQEDTIAYWQKLNAGSHYVHKDFEAGEGNPE